MGTWCLHVQGPRGPGDLVLLAQDARSGEHLCLWPQSRGALLCSATAGVTVFTPETPCWFTVQMEVLSRVRGSPTQLCRISLSWAAGKCGRPVCSLLDSVERSLRHSPWLGLGCGDRGCTPPRQLRPPLWQVSRWFGELTHTLRGRHLSGCLTSLVLVFPVSPSSPRARGSGLGDSVASALPEASTDPVRDGSGGQGFATPPPPERWQKARGTVGAWGDGRGSGIGTGGVVGTFPGLVTST